MKQVFFIFTLVAASITLNPARVSAQQVYDDDIYVIERTGDIPENETNRERKARIERDHEIVDSIYNLKAVRAVQDGYFVLQATEVSNSRGVYTLGLNNNTNFLLMQGDKGIFQVAFNNVDPGLNGLGGMTLHGSIGKKDIKTDKKGNTIITYHMTGMHMNASVTVTIFKESDHAIADVYPTMGNGRITLRGRLVPYRNDNIQITP